MTTAPASEVTALLSDGAAENLRRSRTLSSDDTHTDGYGAVTANGYAGHDGKYVTTWKAELKLLLQYSAPLVITYLLQYSYTMIMIFVAGRLGTMELAASSIAVMTANLTGIILIESMATCLDTLTSQAFGSGKKEVVGLHIQRAVALLFLGMIPVALIWLFSPQILALIIPERDIAELAGAFLRVYLIGAPGYAVFEATKRLTQAQGNFTAPLIAAVICAPLNLLWNWLFVFYLGLGFEGAALAVAVSFNLQPVVLILYINFAKPHLLDCWPGISIRQSFQNWGPMIKLAVPGVLMIMSEGLAFEILTFSASYISSEHLAAQSVLASVGILMFHIPFPTSIAGSTRFGNLIGSGELDAARVAFNAQYAVFIGIGIFDIILLSSLRHVVADIFTDDVIVKGLIAEAMPVVAAMQFFDATTAISNGLLRGLGRQKIGGWVNMGAYYLFAIPLSMLLTFGPTKLELFGLWTGPALGLAICTFIEFFYMRRTDWQKAHEEAKERN